MLLTLALYAADTEADTFDINAHTDLELLNMVTRGLHEDTRYAFADTPENRLPVCEWPMVQCDKSGRVIRIYKNKIHLASGTLNLEFLPPRVFACSLINDSPDLPGERIGGKLHAARLPRGLESLSIRSLQFDGTVDMKRLPPALQTLYLSGNKFSGSCDLTKLPRNLTRLEISRNDFSGTLDLTRLRREFRSLMAANNRFSGELNFAKLPRDLMSLDLSENEFTGEFRFLHTAYARITVNADGNPLEGTAVVHSSLINVSVHRTFITFVVDENGNPSKSKHAILGRATTADGPERSVADFQLEAMLHFADPYLYASEKRYVNIHPLRRYLVQELSKRYRMDPCSWPGVRCDADGVETIQTHRSHDGLVDMDWIPSTVQFVCLRYLSSVNGWVTHRLPRALRFLSMKTIYAEQWDGAKQRKLNLQTLPRRMEELYVQNGHIYGGLCVDNLPPTMRIICIRHHSVQEALVAAATLPEGFQVLCVAYTPEYEARDGFPIKKMGRVKIKWVGKAKDARVTNEVEGANVESKYARRFKQFL